MPDRPTELDLLGWIEGDLPADRRAVVERALTADLVLRRRIDAIRADRLLLRELPPIAAPVGLVRAAIDAAEREALLGTTVVARSGVLARIAAPRRVALAAGLLFIVGGATLAVWSGVLGPRSTIPGGVASNDADMSTTADAAPPERALALAPTDNTPVRTRAAAETRPAQTDVAEASTLLADFGARAPSVAVAELANLGAFEPMEQMPDGGIFPLMRAVRAIDDARIDWSVEGEQYLTLMVAGMERTVPVQRHRAAPLVTPASYDDALRLASMNRLTVRICSKNPGAVDRALRAFSARPDGEARLSVVGASGGDMRYAMELDRTVPEFSALVAALQRADPTTQAFLDVSLLPAARTLGVSWNDAPRQVSNRGPRVRVPIVLECAAAAN